MIITIFFVNAVNWRKSESAKIVIVKSHLLKIGNWNRHLKLYWVWFSDLLLFFLYMPYWTLISRHQTWRNKRTMPMTVILIFSQYTSQKKRQQVLNIFQFLLGKSWFMQVRFTRTIDLGFDEFCSMNHDFKDLSQECQEAEKQTHSKKWKNPQQFMFDTLYTL